MEFLWFYCWLYELNDVTFINNVFVRISTEALACPQSFPLSEIPDSNPENIVFAVRRSTINTTFADWKNDKIFKAKVRPS